MLAVTECARPVELIRPADRREPDRGPFRRSSRRGRPTGSRIRRRRAGRQNRSGADSRATPRSVARSTSSPAACPWVSLTRLKRSKSRMPTQSGGLRLGQALSDESRPTRDGWATRSADRVIARLLQTTTGSRPPPVASRRSRTTWARSRQASRSSRPDASSGSHASAGAQFPDKRTIPSRRRS